MLASAVALATNFAHAEDSKLLDILVRKKILTNKEADEVRAELANENAAKPDNKFDISAPVTSIRLYGDGRFRYSGEEGKQVGTEDHAQRERWRYRLRLGMDVKLQDNWMLGLRLEAGPGARSANVTAGENPAFAKAGTGTGTFATTGGKTGTAVTSVKWEDTIFLGQLYLKYSPTSWSSVEAGRMPNPFVGGNVGAGANASLVWDPDVNPQGVAEQFKYTLAIGGGSSGGGFSKDGKAIAVKNDPGMTIDLFANFGQFVYEDAMENSFNKGTVQTPSRVDRWMLGFQVGAKANFSKTTYLQIAPAFYNYTGGGDATLATYNGDGATVALNKNANPKLVTFNQSGVNDLAVIDVPVEFGWRMWNLPFVVFGEFTDNIDASGRAAKAGHADKSGGIAYAAGLGVGKVKKKGDWEIKAWWQHSEQFSLDPNINDDDIFNGRLNMEGIVARAAYAFTDSASLSLIYANGSRIDSNLGTGGSSSLGSVPLEKSQMLFVDFNLKF